jgi:hypothetical protein
MRFLIAVIDTATNSADADEMQAIDAFNDHLVTNGHWIMAAGITGPESATVIDNRGTQAEIRTGSVFDSAEYMSGFWLIEAENMETAMRLASEGSKACNRKVELRPFIR